MYKFQNVGFWRFERFNFRAILFLSFAAGGDEISVLICSAEQISLTTSTYMSTRARLNLALGYISNVFPFTVECYIYIVVLEVCH